jgi:hypothetical protein
MIYHKFKNGHFSVKEIEHIVHERIALTITFSSLVFLVALPAAANPVFLPTYHVSDSAPIASAVILSCLMIEFVFIKRITKWGNKKTATSVLAMNTASAVPGFFLLGVAYSLTVSQFFSSLFISFVLVDAIIEAGIIRLIFRYKLGWRDFGFLTLANSLTVGICYLCMYLTSHPYEPSLPTG